MSLLRPKSIYKEKIEANFSQPNKIEFPESEIKKQEDSIVKQKGGTLMIGEGVKIIGNITAKEVIIQGVVEGDVMCDSIDINQPGKIKGNIKSKGKMSVQGTADGEVNVEDVLIIKSQGKLSGKIFYRRIQIETGGQLSGETHVLEKNDKKEQIENLKTL